MNGWYVVYAIACLLNGMLLTHLTGFSWEFWVGTLIPILAYLAGQHSRD